MYTAYMAVNKAFLSRNLGLINEEQFEMLASKTILVAGCGIGSVIALGLARTGFHHLILADGDVVEETNLNRQEFGIDDLGKPKVSALAERLRKINQQIEIREFNEFLDSGNLASIVDKADIVIDAIDPLESPMAVVALHGKCRSKNIPIVYPVDVAWGGGVFIFTAKSESLEDMLKLSEHEEMDEQAIREKFMSYYAGIIPQYFEPVLGEIVQGNLENIPQPASAAYATVALSVIAVKRLALGLPVKEAPEFISFDPHIAHLPGA